MFIYGVSRVNERPFLPILFLPNSNSCLSIASRCLHNLSILFFQQIYTLIKLGPHVNIAFLGISSVHNLANPFLRPRLFFRSFLATLSFVPWLLTVIVPTHPSSPPCPSSTVLSPEPACSVQPAEFFMYLT